jgi:hypothetical protein
MAVKPKVMKLHDPAVRSAAPTAPEHCRQKRSAKIRRPHASALQRKRRATMTSRTGRPARGKSASVEYRIEVNGTTAKLFVGEARQSVPIVNDLMR